MEKMLIEHNKMCFESMAKHSETGRAAVHRTAALFMLFIVLFSP